MPWIQNAGTVTKLVVQARSGVVRGVIATNSNAAVRWLQLHNKATAPLATEVPQLYFPLQPGVPFRLNEEDLGGGERFTAGISWAVSTTAATFTDSATAAEHTVSVRTA